MTRVSRISCREDQVGNSGLSSVQQQLGKVSFLKENNVIKLLNKEKTQDKKPKIIIQGKQKITEDK